MSAHTSLYTAVRSICSVPEQTCLSLPLQYQQSQWLLAEALREKDKDKPCEGQTTGGNLQVLSSFRV